MRRAVSCACGETGTVLCGRDQDGNPHNPETPGCGRWVCDRHGYGYHGPVWLCRCCHLDAKARGLR